MSEKITGDDLCENSLYAVVVLSNPYHELVNDHFVITFQMSAKGIGHESFGQVPSQFGLSFFQEIFQLVRGGEGLTRGEFPN